MHIAIGIGVISSVQYMLMMRMKLKANVFLFMVLGQIVIMKLSL